jgi:nickel-dependent lactate racemase
MTFTGVAIMLNTVTEFISTPVFVCWVEPEKIHSLSGTAKANAAKKFAVVGEFVVAQQKSVAQRRTHLFVSTNASMSDTILSSSGA